MSQRDRPAALGAAAGPPRPAAPPPAAVALPPRAADPWDAAFDALPPALRHRLLARAAAGPIPADELPPPVPEAGRQLLARLLAGHGLDELASLPPTDGPDDLPAELDPQQRAAVAAALRTPDLVLVQGRPGTGKSRVAAEVVAHAAARGERVLLVAATPAALDRSLELLADRPAVCPLRLVGREETLTALPPTAARATSAGQTRSWREETTAHARDRLAAARQRCDRRATEPPLFDHLADLAAQQHRLDDRRTDLAARRERIGEDIESTFGTADEDHAATLAHLEAQRDSAHAEADRCRQEAEHYAAKAADLRGLVEAGKGWRFWSAKWRKARAAGDLTARIAGADTKRRDAEAAAEGATAKTESLADDRRERDATYRADRAANAAVELERRRTALADEEAALDRACAGLAGQWRQACDRLAADSPRPDACSPAAVTAARAAWTRRCDNADREHAAAKEWADALPSLLADLPARLQRAANFVAATPAALAADPHFGSAACPPFDLLIVEESHEVSEAEFLSAARRARRWTVIGEPALDDAVPGVNDPGHNDRRGRGWSSPAALRPGFFQRLWRHLHCDAWVRDGGRLVARLRPMAPAQRSSLACEPLADRPEVELRIFNPPDGVPQLAEVAFPPDTPITKAKAYLFRELGEAPIPAPCAAPRWEETPDAVRCILFDMSGAAVALADLGDGVRELVGERPEGGQAPWFTAALDFNRAAGWDHARAEAWVREHVGRHGPARTVRLDTPHRMAPGLARVVADLLGDAHDRPPATDGEAGAVEFVAVPPADRNGHAGRRDGPPRRGGAGFELDIADPRQRSYLPPDVAASLPARGLANLVEARAVVERLERLIADGAPRPIGVLALTAAQAELIRRLVAKSRTLTGADVVIATPPGLRQREVRTLVVSLTRSHTNRAVFYGEEPGWLPLALARGREHLILVGDPGTLVRRAQWEGPLDHLDATAARRERDMVRHLVGYLQGRGRHAGAFRMLEGACP